MSLIILVIFICYGFYAGDMWPAVAALVVFVADKSISRFLLPPGEQKLEAIKEELDNLKSEINSIKFRSMK